MFSRIATRAAFAGKRIAFTPASIRANSSSSSSSAARVMEMAAQAERPSTSHAPSFSHLPHTLCNPPTWDLRTHCPPTSQQSKHNRIYIKERVLTVLIAGAEAAVPIMWAATGVLTYAMWNRMSERSAGENVEKLLIV